MPFSVPTTMMNFFRQSEGVWYTQRTVHHFDTVADESGESNLHITVLSSEDPRVQRICEQQGIDPALAKGGASFMWQANHDEQAPNPDQAAILVDVPVDASGQAGRLLRNQGYVEKIPVVSRYWFGQDGILTIDTDYDQNQGQERCWFITEDFRVRVSTVRMLNGVYLMTYCSERRCITPLQMTELLQNNQLRAIAPSA
ncbi:phycobiliprotein lyase [Synechococcales cyanobacterium C]|uniref:Chromophore lyase CpcS/CpeS n=1 Tax=Petrachloros mirabilis ULC683 TaxID=2781853 RepID=A0A8K1ZY06_9CYAN|nr:phycobiliprotein lyase [Petrachloros mirabilis]NCJ06086.1 phycobiliprotein lyase [Petrachloros mirabilis ULC683]